MTLNTRALFFERTPYWIRLAIGPWRILDVQLDRDCSLHLWVGPAGVHIFCPDVHKSRAGWCSRWWEPLE
jgi:hypothetical protein